MKPNHDSAKRGRAPLAIVFAVAALLALPIAASATHWPNFGGDAGHSGNQPVNAAKMAVSNQPWRQDDAGTNRTSIVISGGDAASGQRIAYGNFINTPNDADDETRIHIRDLATGAEKVPADQQVIDNDTNGDGTGLGSDDIALGYGDRLVTPVSSSTDGGLGQLYVVHNEENATAQTGNSNCAPSAITSSQNDIAIAQFDEATGAKKRDFAIGQAQGRTLPTGDPDPACPPRNQPTASFIIESSPVLTPPLDGTGRRYLFFVARNTAGNTHRLFKVEIENAGSPDANIKATSPETRDIPNLNTLSSPAIAYFRDVQSGFVVPYVVVAVNAAAGASDVQAFRATDITEPGIIAAPIDIPGDPQAISIPTTEDGQLPSPASGDEKAPAMYVSYKDGELTRVHKFVQSGNNNTLTDTVTNPPSLDGLPGPQLALSQVVSAGKEQAGVVLVSTSKNLFALNKDTLAPVQRLRDEGESLLEPGVSGFSRNAPLTSGGFVFIQDDTGIPYVLDLDDLERVDEADFTPEATHLEADYGAGQPAYSNGFLGWFTDRGTYVYTTGVVIPPNTAPVARFGASPNPAQVNQPVTFDASTSSDPDGKGIAKYEWDFDGNGTFEVDRGSDPKATAAFPAAGTYNVGLRVTDVSPGQGSPVKTGTTTQQVVIVPVSAKQPTAAFTATPNPAKVDQRVTFDASTSKDEDGSITKYEWDLDGNGTYETNSQSNPRVQRSYGKAGIYNVKLRVTDNGGNSVEVLRQLAVTGSTTKARKSPRRLTAKVTPKRDATLPYDFRTTGTLTRPSGVSRASGCSGRVTVVVKVGKKTISRRTTALRSNCTFRTSVRFRDRERIGEAGSLRFTARFQGNKALKAKQAKTVRVRVG